MLLSILLAAAQPSPPPEALDCSYDLQAMLQLDLKRFDQDLDGGWRPLGYEECHSEAAELIREWRYQKRSHASILYWHEGQMRANAGQTDQAIALFKLTYKSAEDDADFGWNHYVDGTIAFLRKDRELLARAINQLESVPQPADHRSEFTLPDGTLITMPWPPNLAVLKAFDKCWGKSYREAYGNAACKDQGS